MRLDGIAIALVALSSLDYYLIEEGGFALRKRFEAKSDMSST